MSSNKDVNHSNKISGHKISDEQLSQLYLKRKACNKLPSSLKMDSAKRLAKKQLNKQSWWRFNFDKYTQLGAIAVTALIALLVMTPQLKLTLPFVHSIYSETPENIGYSLVEFHVIRNSSELKGSEELNMDTLNQEVLGDNSRLVDYLNASKTLKNQQVFTQVHHQKYARVIRQNEELALLTCDKALMKISKDVLIALENMQTKFPKDLKQGQIVSITFNQNGQIISLYDDIQKDNC